MPGLKLNHVSKRGHRTLVLGWLPKWYTLLVGEIMSGCSAAISNGIITDIPFINFVQVWMDGDSFLNYWINIPHQLASYLIVA